MFTSTVCSTCSTEPSNLSRWCCAVRRYRLVMMPASLWNTCWKFKQWFTVIHHFPWQTRTCWTAVLFCFVLSSPHWRGKLCQTGWVFLGQPVHPVRAQKERAMARSPQSWCCSLDPFAPYWMGDKERERERERKRMMTGLRNEIWTTCGPTSINNGSR